MGLWDSGEWIWGLGLVAWCQFHQHFTRSFYVDRTQKRKKDSQVKQIFLRFWDLGAQKLLVKCW